MTIPHPHTRATSGFTLIELMIVVVIIGILASVAIPKFSGVSKAAKEAEAAPVLKQVRTLQMRHWERHTEFAATFDELEGAADPVRTARYYEFGMTVDGLDVTVCAKPKAGLDLHAFEMDPKGNVAIIGPSACTPQ
jgi:type IV pilus assembly protein PilE